MANYGTHVLGGCLVGAGAVIAGYANDPTMSWEAQALAFAAAYLGGLFPDMDHDTGIGLGEVSSLTSTLLPVLVLSNLLGEHIWGLMVLIPAHYALHGAFRHFKPFKEHVGWWAALRAIVVAALCAGAFVATTTALPWPWWETWLAMVAMSALVQAVLPFFKGVTVHRGIFHSVPALGIYALAVYLCAFRYGVEERTLMGLAAAGGVLIHLLLDEMYSVDLGGVRLKQSFGTALSFWKPRTPWISALAWALVAFLAGVAVVV